MLATLTDYWLLAPQMVTVHTFLGIQGGFLGVRISLSHCQPSQRA
jgi:hypothetical protein